MKSIPLSKWMKENRWGFPALSKEWEIPEVTLKSWVYRQRNPRPAAQKRIEELTDGAVTMKEWDQDGL